MKNNPHYILRHRKEYTKASKRLNLFTKFLNVVSGKDDADELRIELNAKISKIDKIQEDRVITEMAIRDKENAFVKKQYDMMHDMQK